MGPWLKKKENWSEPDAKLFSGPLSISDENEPFHGCLSHFKIWERVLTKEEIERIMKQEDIGREGLCVEIVKDNGGENAMNLCTKESVELGKGVFWVG